MRIRLVCIATNKYIEYLPQFIESAAQFFFPDHDLSIVVFTDNPIKVMEWHNRTRATVTYIEIPSYKFPEATMLRYHVFSENAVYIEDCDYIFYADIDSKFVDYVGKGDMLAEVIEHSQCKYYTVAHPGFWDNGRGSWETRPASLCYVAEGRKLPYVAGGFLGAPTNDFLNLSGVCSELIRGDLRKGIIPTWHDESALNKFVSCVDDHCMILPPAYVYPEERPDWFTWTGKPKILALKKNHEEVRS